MSPAPPVFLFDIDGVLVEPRGYRAAVHATLQHFLEPARIPSHLLPDDQTLEMFEAHRLTSEWDMVPVSLAILFDQLTPYLPDGWLPARLFDLAPLPPTELPAEIDYAGPLMQIGAGLRAGEPPAETTLRLCQSESASGPCPHISGHPLLVALLLHTRDETLSPTTRIFQHFSLGSRVFSEVYRMPPEIETASLLSTLDRPNLTPPSVARLRRAWGSGRLAMAAYTLRPSGPPVEVTVDGRGYAPEAELALELVGLQDIPMIGFGRAIYLGAQFDINVERLIKPSLVQGLAAILAALTRTEWPALQTAFRLVMDRSESLPAALATIDSPLDIHVFEDSSGGIQAVSQAIERLQASGLVCQLQRWGIASHPAKVRALQAAGATIHPTTESALQAALGQIQA